MLSVRKNLFDFSLLQLKKLIEELMEKMMSPKTISIS